MYRAGSLYDPTDSRITTLLRPTAKVGQGVLKYQ